jgi:Methenyl tetrahydrofolate cyclohydrolase
MNKTIQDFIDELSSKAPVPGGGGASALIGAIGIALCSMVANLTTGKQKYAQYQEDIEVILIRTEQSIEKLLMLIQKDAEVFEPLSAAYGIPKEDPNREGILEEALITASSVPLQIVTEVHHIIDIIEQLATKGSKLAVSDVGVAASACRSALEGAAMNVYINTKLMKNKEYALELNAKVDEMVTDGVKRCNNIYMQITEELRGK